jgi:hypothetical protein
MTRCLMIALLLTGAASAADKDRLKADADALAQADLGTDGLALIEFFKARTPGDKRLADIEGLIRNLGHNSFKVRQKANDELLKTGPQALGPLKAVLNDTDLEVQHRARRLVENIEKTVKPELMASAARLIADRKPAGTVQVLLDHLPFASEPYVIDEIHLALAVAGFTDGKADETLLRALEDKHAVRRGAAGEAFARSKNADARARARPLLKDPDARVRLRVALALVERKEREAVEPLIQLLPEAREQFWRIEQILQILAGDDAPKIMPGTSDGDLREYRTVWLKWWRNKGPNVNLAALDNGARLQGLTLIVQYDGVGARPGGVRRVGMGRVYEVGRDGKVRWEIADLNYPLDAQIVGPDRVLVTEYRNRQVTERNFKGEVQWSKAVPGMPIAAQRLDNGNTLIVARNEVVEVTRTGQEVFRAMSENGVLIGARRLKNGETYLLDRNGLCQRLDARGKEIKRFVAGPIATVIGTSIDVLPNGNLLLPLYNQNRVIEVNADGKEVWEVTHQRPTSASRLPNGNTLIASRYGRGVSEVDRTGKEVWSFQSQTGNILQAKRR